MAVDYTFLASMFSTVDAAVDTYVTATVASVTTAIAPVANQCFLLYMILWGFAMYRGMIDEPILDGTFRMLRLLFISHIAINVGTYSGLIVDNLIALPNYMTTLVANGGTVSESRTVLDDILSDTINTGNKLWESGSILPPDSNPGAYFMAIIVWISAVFCTGYAAFLLILSKVALGVLVGLGPIFIFMSIFDATKKFFDAWIGQCINYVLISAMTISVIKLLFGMYAAVTAGALAASDSADFSFASVASMFLLSVICFLVLMQVQSLAASLGGGVALSTLGAVSWIGRNARNAGVMRPANLQKMYRGMKNDARAVGAAGSKAAAPLVWAQRKMSGGNSVKEAA